MLGQLLIRVSIAMVDKSLKDINPVAGLTLRCLISPLFEALAGVLQDFSANTFAVKDIGSNSLLLCGHLTP